MQDERPDNRELIDKLNDDELRQLSKDVEEAKRKRWRGMRNLRWNHERIGWDRKAL